MKRDKLRRNFPSWCGRACWLCRNYECRAQRDLLRRKGATGPIVDALIRSRVTGEITDITQTHMQPRVQRYVCQLIAKSDLCHVLTTGELALVDLGEL
jgi:hypothetical protein